MTAKEKAAFDDANIESGVGNQTSGQALSVPNSQCTTASAKAQVVVPSLRKGTEDAVSTNELLDHTGCSCVRNLRALVAEERAKGAIILTTSTGGYFLPADGEQGREEMARFVSMMCAKALNTLKAAKPAQAALRVLNGQEEIVDV